MPRVFRPYNRKKLTRATRDAVLTRADNRCEKCGRAERLHINHIRSLRGGGDNSLENLCVLCAVCHSEWHLLEESHDADFRAWCAAPPLAELYQRYALAAGTPPPAPRDHLLGRKKHTAWGPPPLGVTVDPSGMRRRDEEGLKVVDLIFRLRSEGWSTCAIAKHLTEQGVPARRGGAWTSGKISWMLRHPHVYYNAEVADATDKAREQ